MKCKLEENQSKKTNKKINSMKGKLEEDQSKAKKKDRFNRSVL